MHETIMKHRSIRKYKNTPVNEKDLNEILEAGIRASTTGNMQLYSVIVTQDEQKKKELAPTHFNQPMVVQAPVHLTFCADINRFHKWCENRDAEPGYDNFLWFFNAAIDALLVSENVCLAAEEKGMGICYLGTVTYNADQIIKILDIPQGVVPVAAIVMGYPDESPGLTDRLPLEGVVHYETYKDYKPADIDRIYAEKEALEETKQLLKENNKETLAQVFTDNRYKKEDNLHFTKQYLKVLQQQGFMNNI
ncbi:MAG: NADPH-dependent oxidoreductase [Bacteroidales bacterium]